MSCKRFHIEKTLGEGPECAYLLYYPSQAPRVPGLGLRLPAPMKIGHTRRDDLLIRVAALAAGSPEDPVIALEMRGPDGQFIERALHARFKADRVKGEWFRTTPEDVEEAYLELGRPQYASVGEMLRHYRRLMGLNQGEVARRAGVRQEAVSRIETGGSTRTGTVERIAEELGLRLTLVQKYDETH